MGLLLIGIGIGTPLALFWVLFYMLVHVLVKEALLFAAGILHRQYGSNLREDMRDVFELQPRAAWTLVLGSIAIVGMPPFPLFPAKFFILLESAAVSPYLTLAVLLLLILAAAAFANFLLKAFSRVTKEKASAEEGEGESKERESKERENKERENKERENKERENKEGEHGKKAGYRRKSHQNRYIVKAWMKIPTVFMLALALLLGIWFPEQLKELLEAIVLELGYV